MKAAIFDLDGTLLDSMYVWQRVDKLFFARRGMDFPEDYPKAVASLGFRRTAVYTKERFHLAESIGEIMDEWSQTARDEYARHVPLKEGSREFLETLREKGVRLCVATALCREMYEPCLARNGILDLFEFVLTADQTEGGKSDGSLYRLAAEKMGVDPADCAVFEDVPEAVFGAKQAGMKVYCVIDPHSTHRLDEIRAVAEDCAEKILDLRIRETPAR